MWMPGGFERARETSWTQQSSSVAAFDFVPRYFGCACLCVLQQTLKIVAFCFDRPSSCFLQEVEKARQSQESIIRELRAKSEADRNTHAEEVERIKVL